MDGNFAAEHQKLRCPEDDVSLMDGEAFFVNSALYKTHLATGKEIYRVRANPDIFKFHIDNWSYLPAVRLPQSSRGQPVHKCSQEP